jgi:uncharacterized protein YcnI
MNRRRGGNSLRSKLICALGAVALVVVSAGPASAHVSTNPAEGPAGGFLTFDFQVGHGCDDSPTTALAVQIAEGVGSVTPEEEPGWELTTAGSEENVTDVTWTATGRPLDPHHLARFGMSVQLPEGEVGDVIYFPTIQTCEQGVTRWIEIPTGGETEEDLESPAPAIVLTEEGEGHGGAEESDESEDESAAAAEDIPTEPAKTTDEGTDTLSWVALGVGVLALLMGGAALARSRG